MGSGSVGSLAAAPPDFVRLPTIHSSVSLCLPASYAAVPPSVSSAFLSCALSCYFGRSHSFTLSLLPLLWSPLFFLRLLMHPPPFLLFPGLLLLLFRLRVFPLPLLSSVLAPWLRPSLGFSLVCLFYCFLLVEIFPMDVVVCIARVTFPFFLRPP